MNMRRASTEDSEPGARYAWRVLSVTSIGVLLTGVNTSTLTVALPVVSGHFKATPSQANWILLSYMLVNTVLILAFGRVADLFGRRRMYIVRPLRLHNIEPSLRFGSSGVSNPFSRLPINSGN